MQRNVNQNKIYENLIWKFQFRFPDFVQEVHVLISFFPFQHCIENNGYIYIVFFLKNLFLVTPKGEMPRDNYLDPISNQCPPGASIDAEVETFPIESYPESARDKHNGNHDPKNNSEVVTIK